MKAIAVFNNKGGVGKTTLLCNLAAYLARYHSKKILVIDADPQCNATQSMFTDSEIDSLYDNAKTFTIYSVLHPLSLGKGYSESVHPAWRSDFGCDVIIGDPRLSLKEDLLARDWSSAISGEIRGLRTTFVFSELLARCTDYDFVLFDMGPSLGSINRACLLSCDYFISPMSIDIFSLRAIENIRISIENWRKSLSIGIQNIDDQADFPDNARTEMSIKFAGYVTQQYTAKTTGKGEKRAVNAYERIMRKIPKTIKDNFVEHLQPNERAVGYALGSVPNLHSLIPMAQFARKPIFELKAKDGVVGAHFGKVQEAKKLFGQIAQNLLRNVEDMAS